MQAKAQDTAEVSDLTPAGKEIDALRDENERMREACEAANKMLHRGEISPSVVHDKILDALASTESREVQP